MGTRCRATKGDGMPCRAWAVQGTDPPRCAAHGGAPTPPGAPAGNNNAQTHGAYTSAQVSADLTARIDDLDRRIRQLSDYIDHHLADLAPEDFTRLAALQGQLSSRLGRLMRDRIQIDGQGGDELTEAINKALDELSQEWDIEL